MEGTPQLLTDVKFTQLRKGGYDPEEVDNYLERINDAVAKLAENLRGATDRAETAESQLADAKRAQEEAESELERIRSGGMVNHEAAAGGSPDEEVARVLVLAQRAADQAVEEANATAAKTLADARAKSVNLLADAEQERERLLVKAHKKADAVAEERVRTLNEQVAALSVARTDLEADVEALTTHLEGERERLREHIESVRAALDDPAGLRVAPGPELRNTPIPAVDLPSTHDRPSPFAPTEPVEAVEESEANAPAASLDSPDVDATGIDEGDGINRPAADADEAEGSRTTIVLDDAEGASDQPDELDGSDEKRKKEERSLFDAAPRRVEHDTPSSSELFENNDEHPLGPPDAEADAAMRAFFERDLDDPAVSARGRFGRRR
jgi:DivIVA domain-containing protein